MDYRVHPYDPITQLMVLKNTDAREEIQMAPNLSEVHVTIMFERSTTHSLNDLKKRMQESFDLASKKNIRLTIDGATRVEDTSAVARAARRIEEYEEQVRLQRAQEEAAAREAQEEAAARQKVLEERKEKRRAAHARMLEKGRELEARAAQIRLGKKRKQRREQS